MAVPKLRFAGFNDEWKTYTLSDILSLVGGNAFSSKDASKNGVNWLKIANVGFGNVTWDVQDYLPLDFKDKYPNYLLDCGDIILTLTRPILNGNLKIAEVTSRDLPALLNQRVAKLQINEDMVDKKYIFHLLRNRKTILKIESSISGTDPPNLGNNELRKILVTIPLINESKKIAKFMDIVDKKIQLQQEKIDLLKEQKKGFMQKIFSRELRFKNKDGQEFPAWENKLIGEIGDIIMGQSPDGSSYSEDSSDTVLVQGNADLKNGKIVPRIYTSKITKMATIGDIILTVRAPVGVVAKCNIPACIGRGVCAIRSDDFLFYYLDYYYITSQWSKLSQGSTFESVNSNDIKNIIVPQPSTHEKEVIISFFDRLSQKIHLAEGALSELEKQKQAFMQQMFI